MAVGQFIVFVPQLSRPDFSAIQHEHLWVHVFRLLGPRLETMQKGRAYERVRTGRLANHLNSVGKVDPGGLLRTPAEGGTAETGEFEFIDRPRPISVWDEVWGQAWRKYFFSRNLRCKVS